MSTITRTSTGARIRTYAPGERKPGQRSAPSKPAVYAKSARDVAEIAGTRAMAGAAMGSEAAIDRAFGRNPVEERRYAAFDRAIRGGQLSVKEKRDVLESGTGGYVAPPSYFAAFIENVVESSALWQHARRIVTPRGSPLTLPLAVADTAVDAGVLAEGVTFTESDPVFASASFTSDAPLWVSDGLYQISRALSADSGIPVLDIISELHAERVSRATDASWVPTLQAAVPSGNKVTTSVAATLDWETIVKVATGALNARYRRSPHAAWLVSPSAYQAIATLRDEGNHAVMVPNRRGADSAAQGGINGGHDGSLLPTLCGFPVWETPALPNASTSGNVPIILADLHRAACIRVVGDEAAGASPISYTTLVERFADSGAIGIVGYLRADFAVVVPNALAAVTIL